MPDMDLRISVQASPADRPSWVQLAREVEQDGLHALYAADHPGTAPSQFVALAAAAAVTERLRLGTCVVNAGVWEPLALASAVATLDVVSGGRAILGVGAGHTPIEWTATGRAYPSAGERVARMIETIEATGALLDGGATSYRGDYVTLVDAVLDAPRPVQRRIPLLIGGNGERVVRFAARHADVVGISGLARTLPDGHRHEVDWHPGAVDRQLALIASESRDAGRRPEIEALVQVVQITDDPVVAAERIAPHIPGASATHLLETPFAWIGSEHEIVQRIRRFVELGVGNYVVRSGALADVRRILEVLT